MPFHRSTLILLLVPVTIWSLITVPGEPEPTNIKGVLGKVHNHGWPLVHLKRFVEVEEVDTSVSSAERENGPFASWDYFDWSSRLKGPLWSDPLNWSFLGSSPSFNRSSIRIQWSALAINLCVLIFGLLPIAIVVEVRLRRRLHSASDEPTEKIWFGLRHHLRFSLRELGVVALIVGGVLAFCLSIVRETREQQLATKRLKDDFYGVSFWEEDFTPVWVSRLLDDRWLQVDFGNGKGSVALLKRPTEVTFERTSLLRSTSPPVEIAKNLLRLKQVDTFVGLPRKNNGGEVFSHGNFDHIKSLRMTLFQATGAECIGKLQGLEALEFVFFSVTKEFTYPELTQLKSISIDAYSIRKNEKILDWALSQPALEELRVPQGKVNEIQARVDEMNKSIRVCAVM